MIDEPEDEGDEEGEGEDEDEGYTPQPIVMGDGDIVIADPLEFAVEFNCHAWRYDEGVLFVLCRGTRTWVPVEGRKPGAGKLHSVN
jgi:hypothetical protein